MASPRTSFSGEPSGTASAGDGPLSLYLLSSGSKGVPGKPLQTIKKADTQTVVKYVKNLVEQSRNHMQRHWYRVWERNAYFTYGAQHIEQDQEGRWSPRQLAEDDRHVTNLILPRVMRVVSKMVGAKPSWSVTPRDSTPEETARARTAEKLLRAIYNHKKVLPRRIMVELSKVVFGSGILKVYWDPRAGTLREGKTPIFDGNGQQVGEQPTGKFQEDGDLVIREVLPQYFHVPVSASSPIVDDCDWVAERSPLTLAEIWQRFRYAATADTSDFDPIARLASDFTRFIEASDIGFTDSRPQDQANVIEYHEKPRNIPGFERGLILTIINDHVVSAGPQQLPPEAGYPYVHFLSWMRPATFWGHSSVNEMIHPQRLYNTDRKKLSQARDLTALPWLWDPLGSGLPEGALTDGPRVLKGVQEPKFIGPPPMSQALVEDQAQNLMDMDRVNASSSVAHEGGTGKSPYSADAIQMLKESEESVLQPQILMAVGAYSDLGQKALELVKRFMREERMYVVGGSSADYGAFMVSGRDVPALYHVEVAEDSALYSMKSALRQEIMMAMQLGLYGQPGADPIQNQKMLDYLKYPTPGDLTPPEVLDRRVAIREHVELLENGNPPMVNPLENKIVHLSEHIRRTKEPDFDHWPPQAQQILMAHIEMTQQMTQAEQAKGAESQWLQQLQQQVLEAVGRGKFRDADAMLLAIRGILEKLELQKAEAEAKAQQGQQQGPPQ